jgi:4-azaleucine resistance transporter AzlC
MRGFISGLRAGFPIFLGYFPVAVSFGLLSANADLSFLTALGFSAVVFAGASQFMAVLLLSAGTSVSAIITATFLVNLRHLLMSASVASRLSERFLTPLLAFGVTDETFALAAETRGANAPRFMLGLELSAYSGWVTGTILGHSFGDFLPPVLQTGLGFGLYSLFVVLLVGPIKRNLRNLWIAAAAGVSHVVFSALEWPGAGLRIVAAMCIGAAVGAILKEAESDE